MYKLINLKGLGVAGRQNELIELALTHKYSGVEVDMLDLVGRHDALGKEFACQFLQSANMDLGTFDLPVQFGASKADFDASCESLDTVIDLATTLKATRCRIQIQPNSDDMAFQENFEQHRERIHDIAEKLAPHNIKVGLSLQATLAKEADGNFKFIQTAEEIMTLVKTIGHSNVGVCLDLFEWQVGGGGMDQVSDLTAASITEVCLADVPEDADPATLKDSNRALPCDGVAEPLSLKVCQHLLGLEYDGAYSISTDLNTFANGGSRHRVVARLSAMLDKLGAGEDPTPPVVEEAPEEGAEGEAAEGETKATEGEAKTAEGTETAKDAAPADKATDAEAPAASNK